jgi:peptide deformylase
MVRDIVIFGDPVLRQKCASVTEVTDEIRTLVEDMIETMQAAEGIGLAAPQVGVPLQLAVVDVSEATTPMTYLRVDGQEASLADYSPLVFTNPELEFPSKPKGSINEGCLSFPELRAPVQRPEEVRAKLTLLDGRQILLETDGLFGRAIQHETDHLNGILFIDRTTAAAKLSLKKKIKFMQEDWGLKWTPVPGVVEE